MENDTSKIVTRRDFFISFIYYSKPMSYVL